MKYPVIVHSTAAADAEEAHAFLRERDPAYADRWTDELNKLFELPAEFPNRYARAPQSLHTTYDVRQVMVGAYRVLFAVRGDTVRIMRISHGARLPFKPGEID